MTIKTRVKKIETASGLDRKNKYMLVVGNPMDELDPEPEPGYKIQPFIVSAGGTGGDPFYLATWADVEAFEARPDVQLTIIEVVHDAK